MIRRSLHLLHASDAHVGTDLTSPSHDHRGECICGVLALQAQVSALQPDFVLITGDLFDNARVSEGTVESVWHRLEEFGVPTVVLPGNHDVYDTRSIYRREVVRSGRGVVHLIDSPSGQFVSLLDGSIAVWGRAMSQHTPQNHPLEGAPDHGTIIGSGEGVRWYVVAAHGHHTEGQPVSKHWSSLVTPAEVEATGADYVALGHWHSTSDVTSGRVPAWYPTRWSAAGHWQRSSGRARARA